MSVTSPSIALCARSLIFVTAGHSSSRPLCTNFYHSICSTTQPFCLVLIKLPFILPASPFQVHSPTLASAPPRILLPQISESNTTSPKLRGKVIHIATWLYLHLPYLACNQYNYIYIWTNNYWSKEITSGSPAYKTA